MPTDLATAETVRADGRASYFSRISRRHRYLCMATPKVACSTVKYALHALEGRPLEDGWRTVHEIDEDMRLAAFATEEVAEILASPEWLRFTFVRNPYERLFSSWKDKIANREDTYYQPLHATLRQRYGYDAPASDPVPLVAFRDFVDFVVTGADGDFRDDGHWAAQVDVMRLDAITFHVIGRFETFATDFTEILCRLAAPQEVLAMAHEVTNPTAQVPLAAAYDASLAARVFEHYRRDFEEFDYPEDSWMYL